MSGHILVMDDDDLIQVGLTAFLNLFGFTVSTALNGDDAASLYKKYYGTDRAFAVVILDLTIPGGVGGLEALHLLQKIDPEVRAIISSGYSGLPVLEEYLEHGFSGKLNKPFTPDDLQRSLSEALGV